MIGNSEMELLRAQRGIRAHEKDIGLNQVDAIGADEARKIEG